MDNVSEKQLIDEVVNYWNQRPCNIRHSAKPVGSVEYFDEVEKRKYCVEPHIPQFADFNSWQGKRVLEIGCGIGTDTINFARAGAHVTAVDLSEESLKIASQRAKVFGLSESIEFSCCNCEELSNTLPHKSFDLVYSFGVIHHTPNPQKAIDEIAKLGKLGAKLKLMLYATNSWKNALIMSGFDQPEAQAGCPVAFTYTDQTVRDLLVQFSSIKISQDHIFPYQVEHYVNYDYVKEEWFQAMPEEMFRSLEKAFGWHLLIDAEF